MKITRVTGIVYRQSLILSGPQPKFAGEPRTSFETLLVKVETDEGLVGWGEAFPHRVWKATRSLIETLIEPACIGADPTDISTLMNSLIRKTYGIGRAGPVMYALSGLDIALWDILGKVAKQPIHKLLGGGAAPKIPVYASLLKYNDTKAVIHYCEQALSRGFTDIKVHETGYGEIGASVKLLREAKGGPVMVDVNAPWTLQEAVAKMEPLRELGLKWIEEPVWPPEDFRALAIVRETGVPIAIGETVQTPNDFARLIESRAADYIQPSVAKIGGISVVRDIYTLANQASVAVVPHSAYFGPGLIATVHLSAALSRAPFVERLYVDLADDPFGDWYVPKNRTLQVPQGPGLGVEPDLKLLEKLRVD
jgi:L-alanine-DL-glutamate epimerase-like enolase superfamily enzyme